MSGDLPPEPLGAAALPGLMHRLNNTTQLLTTLSAIVSGSGGDTWLAKRSEDLAHASRRTEELGYVLAVLASAAGADLLLDRRRPDGIALLLDATRDALRRGGRDLVPLEGELPPLDPHAGRGWELPWAVAAITYAAGSASDGALRFALGDFRAAGLTVVLPGEAGPAVLELEPALRARLGEVRIERGDDEVRVHLAVSPC